MEHCIYVLVSFGYAGGLKVVFCIKYMIHGLNAKYLIQTTTFKPPSVAKRYQEVNEPPYQLPGTRATDVTRHQSY